jgi:DNA-binding MarR family transcriptional regulator
VTSDEQLGQMAELFIRVSKRLRAEEARRYAPYGLTPTQGWTLCALADSPEPLRMKDLAAILGVVPRAVTPQVDVLEAAGLVRRRPDPHNRRSTFIDLTEDGATVREALVQHRKFAAADLFAPLTARQRAAMLKVLETIANAEQSDHDHSPATTEKGHSE